MNPQQPSPEQLPAYVMPFNQSLDAIRVLDAEIQERAHNKTPGLESNLRDAWANFIPVFGMWAQMACETYAKNNNPEDVRDLGEEIQGLINSFTGLEIVDATKDEEFKKTVANIKLKIEAVLTK